MAFLTIGLLVSSIFILSWLPRPQLLSYPIVGLFFGDWLDHPDYYSIRTAVPFIPLGFFLFTMLGYSNRMKYRLMHSISLSVVVVLLAELGQLLRPGRYFDWHDIIWGFYGAVFGSLISLVLVLLVAQINGKKAVSRQLLTIRTQPNQIK